MLICWEPLCSKYPATHFLGSLFFPQENYLTLWILFIFHSSSQIVQFPCCTSFYKLEKTKITRADLVSSSAPFKLWLMLLGVTELMLLAECCVQQIRTALSNVPRQMTGESELQEQALQNKRWCLCSATTSSLPSPPPLPPLAAPGSQWALQRAHPAQFQRICCSWGPGMLNSPAPWSWPLQGFFPRSSPKKGCSGIFPVSLKKNRVKLSFAVSLTRLAESWECHFSVLWAPFGITCPNKTKRNNKTPHFSKEDFFFFVSRGSPWVQWKVTGSFSVPQSRTAMSQEDLDLHWCHWCQDWAGMYK